MALWQERAAVLATVWQEINAKESYDETASSVKETAVRALPNDRITIHGFHCCRTLLHAAHRLPLPHFVFFRLHFIFIFMSHIISVNH